MSISSLRCVHMGVREPTVPLSLTFSGRTDAKSLRSWSQRLSNWSKKALWALTMRLPGTQSSKLLWSWQTCRKVARWTTWKSCCAHSRMNSTQRESYLPTQSCSTFTPRWERGMLWHSCSILHILSQMLSWFPIERRSARLEASGMAVPVGVVVMSILEPTRGRGLIFRGLMMMVSTWSLERSEYLFRKHNKEFTRFNIYYKIIFYQGNWIYVLI